MSNNNNKENSPNVFENIEELPKGRPKRGRKRKISNQSRADKKRLLNNNKPYVNNKGELVDAKVFDETFNCKCTKNCTDAVGLELRKQFFNQFRSMGTHEGRCAMIVGSVTQMPKKRTYTKSISNRFVSRIYTIFGRRVCKNAFLKTLEINESRVKLALNKQTNLDTYADCRGKCSGGWNALSQEIKLEVHLHIESFPRYVSHYCRKQTDAKFLNSNLNLAKMFDLYKTKHKSPVSFSTYKRIFYDNYNLRFKRPKKDTCLRCDLFVTRKSKAQSAEEIKEIEESHNAHLEKAALLRAQMNNDLALAKTNEKLETLTYDQQKTHDIPNLTTSIAYYKRQLKLFNLGIHVGSTGKCVFNLWLEFEASRGTQEVGSCLKKHIEKIEAPVTELILWSDACGGQNRSIKLILMLIHTLQNHPSLEKISTKLKSFL